MSAVFYENKVQKGTVKASLNTLTLLLMPLMRSKGKTGSRHDRYPSLPRHDLEHVIYEGESPSPVRWFTLTGALFGGIMIRSSIHHTPELGNDDSRETSGIHPAFWLSPLNQRFCGGACSRCSVCC